MRITNDKVLSRLIALFAIAVAGCQSADPIPFVLAPDPALPARTACQKADAMWNERILPSVYRELPPLTAPGFFDLLTLTTGNFSVKALTTQGDELEAGHAKLIHARGAEARMRLVISAGAAGGYSGIYRSGAECVIGRFSLAGKPASDTSIPALALKIFIGGSAPSVNLHLMHSVDGQAGHNFFGQTFSNILPSAEALPKRVLASGFKRSAEQFGAKDPNPGRLTLEHLAATLANGNRVSVPKAPEQLLFKPTAQARALMQNAGAKDDFRVALAGLQIGQAVYDIYTMAAGDVPENARLLGQLILTAPIVSSSYGDEKLYFRHNMARN